MFKNTTDTCIYNHLIQRGENLLKDNSEKYHSYVDQQEVLRLQFIWANNDYKFLKSWLDIACEDSLMMKSDHGDLVSHYKVLLQNNLVKEILDYGEARETLQLRFIALMSQCKDLKSCLDAANKNMISLKSACNDSSRGNEVLQNKVSTAEFLDYSRQRETLHLKCVEAIDECERLNKRLTEAHETITLLNSKHVDLASRFQVLSMNEMVKEFFDYAKDQEKLQPNVTEKIEEDECTNSCIEQANENTKLLNLQLTEVKETLLMERLRFEQILNEKQSLSHLSDQLRCLLSKYQATMNEEIDEISTTTDESAQNSTNIYNESDSSSVSKISITEMRIGNENASLCTNSNLNHQHSNVAENNHPIVGANNNGEPNSSHISDITIVESQIEIKEEDLCDDSSQDRQLSNPGESNDDLIEVKDEITDENTETLNFDVVVQDKSTEKSSETDSLPKTMLELDDGTSKNFCCGVCDQSFSTSSSLEEHMNSHKKRKNIPSRIPRVRECLKIPTNSSKEHVNNSQDKCPYEPSVLEEAPLFNCMNCNKNYRNERDLSGDIGTHTSRSEQSAKNCVENPKGPRTNESDLSDHMRTHNNNPNHLTDKSLNNAEKSVSKPAILKTTRHFSCTQCDKKYPNESDFPNHMKMHVNSSKQHAVKSQDKNNTEIRRDSSCCHCDEKCSNESDLSDRAKKHKSISKQNANTSINKKKRKRTYESDDSEDHRDFSCIHCDKNYPNESDLSDHMKAHKNGSVQRTNSSHNEKKRKRVCEPEDPKDSCTISCAHCDRKYSEESDLSEHMKTHTNTSKQRVEKSLNENKRKRISEPEDHEDSHNKSLAHSEKKNSMKKDLSDRTTRPSNSPKQNLDNSHNNNKKKKLICKPKDSEVSGSSSSAHSDERNPTKKKLSNLAAPAASRPKQHSENSHDNTKAKTLSKTNDLEVSSNNSSAHSNGKNPIKKRLSDLSKPPHTENVLHENKKKSLSKPKDLEVSGSSSSAHSDERNPTKKKLSNLIAPPANSPKQYSKNSLDNTKAKPLIKTKDPKVSSNNSSAHSNEKNPIKKNHPDLSKPSASNSQQHTKNVLNDKKKKSLSKPKDPEVSGSSPSAHSDKRNPTKKKLSNVTTPSVNSSKQHLENSYDNVKKKLLSKPKDAEGSRNNSFVHSDGKNPIKKDVSNVKKPSASRSQQHAKNVLSQKKKKPICKLKDPEAARNFSCAYCDKKYSKESDLSDHMKTHRKKSLNQRSDDSSNPKKRKRICEQEDRSSKKLAKNVHNEEQKNPASKPKAPKVSVSNSSPHCDIANSDLTTSITSSFKLENAHSNKKKSLSKPKNHAEVPGKSSSAHCGEKNHVKSEISDLMEPSTSSPQQHAENSRNNERKASKSEPKDPEVLVDNVSACTDEENSTNKTLSDPTAPSTSGSKRRAENSQNVMKKKKKLVCKSKDLEVTRNNSSAHRDEENVKSELSNLIEPSTSSQKQHEENSRNNKEKTSTDQAKNAEIPRNNSSERVDEKNPIKSDFSDVTKSSTSSLQQQSNQPLNKTKKKQTLESQVREPYSLLHCAHCEKKCHRKSDLASHVKTHISNLYEQNPHFIKKEIRESDEIDVYYNCKYCDKKYRRKKEMVQHVKIHTEPGFKDTLKCNICGKSFASKVSLNYHQAVHTSDKLHKCAFCHVRFKSSSSRIRHESKFHKSDDKVYCAHCDKAFNRKANLEKHIGEKHINFKEIRCDICQKEFPFQYLLTEHKHVHEKKRPFQCDECGKTFITNHKLKTHELTHKPRDPSNMDTHCDLCKRHFSSKSNLKEHMKMIHDGIKPFKCPTCGRKFYKKKDLEHHLTLYDLGDHVKCSFCDKSFHFDVNRIKHEEVHQGKGDGFGCAHCDRVYFDKVAITRHLREKHPQYIVEPLKCTVCGKCFVNKSQLENHEMKEHDIDEVKPIKCTLCDARFRLKNSLSAHKMRKHKGTPRLKPVRRYECKICPKVFFVRSSFRSHVYKKHRNERKNISEAKEQDPPVPELNRKDAHESTEMNVSGITEQGPPEPSKEDHPELGKEGPPELSKEDHLELNAEHFPELNKLDPVELNKEQSLELNKLDPVELNKEQSLELSKLDHVELNTEQSPELSKEGSPELKPSTTIVLPLSAY